MDAAEVSATDAVRQEGRHDFIYRRRHPRRHPMFGACRYSKPDRRVTAAEARYVPIVPAARRSERATAAGRAPRARAGRGVSPLPV